jgi:nucleoside-diphosphate-sugar epimerase
MRRLLLTGAAGKVGACLRDALRERYEWVLTDQKEVGKSGGQPFYQADITDLAALRGLCEGIDTVVHCAASSQLTAGWDELLPNNIIGLYNILQAATEGGCRRVILTSSYHVVFGYPAGQPVPLTWPAYPVNLYGASKVLGESLASVFAHQSALSIICLRLGAVKQAEELGVGQSILAEVITYNDLIRLVIAAIEAPDTVRFGCFHGLSNNRHKRLDISETVRVLGYRPCDDAFALAWHNQFSWVYWWRRVQQKFAQYGAWR